MCVTGKTAGFRVSHKELKVRSSFQKRMRVDLTNNKVEKPIVHVFFFSSMVNTAVTGMFPSHGTKRLASEELWGEWENKRLNHGRYKQSFSYRQINDLHTGGYEHIKIPDNDRTSDLTHTAMEAP
ncbi:hypothetical protein IFM89_013696 [Coptis chinensis]|uniref:Uncharacterized protein n=1 Tax=Coptis chinensis TaxID=261450 RepID=A0A835LE94_9MAGN|nr:hypothetical protein IFM89_013696 [Coptis chinensis]